jgi:hypothetical protein
VQRHWRHEFTSEPPTLLTVLSICAEFGADGTLQDMQKQQSGKLVHHQVGKFCCDVITIHTITIEVFKVVCS